MPLTKEEVAVKLEATVGKINLAAEDGKLTLTEVFQIGISLVSSAVAVYDQHETGDCPVDAVVSAVSDIWQTYVVAYNWPRVPEFLERSIESAFWSQIEIAIRSACAHKEG